MTAQRLGGDVGGDWGDWVLQTGFCRTHRAERAKGRESTSDRRDSVCGKADAHAVQRRR